MPSIVTARQKTCDVFEFLIRDCDHVVKLSNVLIRLIRILLVLDYRGLSRCWYSTAKGRLVSVIQ